MRTAYQALLAIVCVIALASCGGGSGRSNRDSLLLGSTFAAISQYLGTTTGVDGLVYFLVWESDQNNLDLNGDLDAGDNVMHVMDPATGVVANLGVAGSSGVAGSGSRVAWAVSELMHFATDFSGDGDLNDHVAVLYDASLPLSATNPGITGRTVSAGSFFFAEGDFAIFLTSEADQGNTDLNGDGDATDDVITILDLQTGTFQTVIHPWAGGALAAANGYLLYASPESAYGPMGTDWTGDGDTNDVAVFLRRLSDGMTWTVPVPALASSTGVAGLYGTEAQPVVAYLIDEGAPAMAASLNSQFGDADTSDEILAVWDVFGGTVVLPLGGVDVDPDSLAASEDRLVFAVRESQNGPGIDLNSDGDTQDRVLFWLDLFNPAISHGTGLAIATTARVPAPRVCDRLCIFLVSESDQGNTNLNPGDGDADTSDNVAFAIVMEGVNTQSFNTGLATDQIRCFPGESLFFLICFESDQGGVDLNNNGSTGDLVPIMFTQLPGGTFLRGAEGVNIDGPISFQVCPGYVRIWGNAKETNIYGDINNDGDLDDYGIVVTRISRPEGKIVSFRPVHASDQDGTSPVIVIDDQTVLFPFSEAVQGPGLNGNAPSGDTDVADTILMVVRTDCL